MGVIERVPRTLHGWGRALVLSLSLLTSVSEQGSRTIYQPPLTMENAILGDSRLCYLIRDSRTRPCIINMLGTPLPRVFPMFTLDVGLGGILR